jgi:hypothetical protein
MANQPIQLSELIAELRRELATAQAQGQGHDIQLKVEEAAIELQVVVTREGGVGAGVKFWVFNAEAKDKLTDATTQKITLKLKPTDAGDRDLKIRGSEQSEEKAIDAASGDSNMRATE